MSKLITNEWLLEHGFQSKDGRVYFLNDLGYDLGIVKRAVVKMKHGFLILKDIQSINELSDLNYVLTGKHLFQ